MWQGWMLTATSGACSVLITVASGSDVGGGVVTRPTKRSQADGKAGTPYRSSWELGMVSRGSFLSRSNLARNPLDPGVRMQGFSSALFVRMKT